MIVNQSFFNPRRDWEWPAHIDDPKPSSNIGPVSGLTIGRVLPIEGRRLTLIQSIQWPNRFRFSTLKINPIEKK